jgi:hypothetical protein
MIQSINDTDNYINNIVAKINPNKDPKSKSDTKCAPGLKYEAGSCARLSILVELAKAYNYSAPIKDKIRMSDNLETLNPQKYKLYLVDQINQRIGEKCTTQKCWAQQDFLHNMEKNAREEFTKHTHRPDSPQGKFEWLSTFDINDVMAQYYKMEKGFKFFGAVPMDFADLSGIELASVDYNDYNKKGITKLGVIFNLDNHDQPGSHWTAMYTDLEKGNIFYFDSFGTKPEPRVRALMRQQARFLESQGKDVNKIRVDYNKIQHQFKNSECGVYSTNFLIRMARGDDFDKLCNNAISDNKMNKCRRVYFDGHSVKKN